MKHNFFNHDDISAYDAQYEAQKIAFAPIIFQVVRILRDKGILALLHKNRKTGLSFNEIIQHHEVSRYGLKILLETGLSAKVVKTENKHYFLTKTGFFLLKDEMTKINMDYTHHVNYQALFYLEQSIEQGKPIGLKSFGNWQTIYPGLTSLPKKVQDSWFKFDHFYSDSAFADVLQQLEQRNIKTILDVGGNTGKFSVYICQHNKDIHITIVDLEQQIKVAQQNILDNGFESRIDTFITDILETNKELPKQHDIIWMSQFLDCFSEKDIGVILKKAAQAMSVDTELWIMEPLWDRQKFETSAYCIINTSPYFTCMANGYSKMYHSDDLLQCIKESGLQTLEIIDNLGICQSIIRCSLNPTN
ncbi:MAG: class I SAM-dependent methyltransferase [Pseudomonadota bacterium]